MKKNLNKKFQLALTFPFMLSLALTLTFTLFSCSDSDIAGISSGEEENGEFTVTGTMANVAVFEEGAGEQDGIRSKAQVYYDRVGGKLMFSWYKPASDDVEYDTKVDKIGIFAATNSEVQMGYKLNPDVDLIQKETTTTGTFMSMDPDVENFTNGTRYYSYYPYNSAGGFTSANVPISYAGQVQTANEQMGYYFNWDDPEYLESEKEAAAHLGKYNYMVSSATSPTDQYVKFYYNHVGSIVRFYMTCPSGVDENVFYDSLQVYNSEANFTIEATMNISEKSVMPTRTSHVMSLGFHPAIDMTCNNKHDATTSTEYGEYEKKISWYWKKNGTKGYIMAYMMTSPINLHEYNEFPTLYLIGRQAAYYTREEYNAAKGYEDGDDGYMDEDDDYAALPKIQRMKIYEASELRAYNTAKGTSYTAEQFAALPLSDRMKGYTRKFYKAELVKLNLEASKHHQWVPVANPDGPITFEEITIQEWEEGTGFTNDDGVGTEDW